MSEDDEETRVRDRIDIEYSPNHEFHFHMDLSGIPEGVRKLLDQLAGGLADFIQALRENEYDGQIGEIGEINLDEEPGNVLVAGEGSDKEGSNEK